MKCYDWSNKNLRVVEWVRCKERMPEEEKLCAIKGDVGLGHFRAIAVWTGECWKEEDRDGFAWGSNQVQCWLLIPELPEEE